MLLGRLTSPSCIASIRYLCSSEGFPVSNSGDQQASVTAHCMNQGIASFHCGAGLWMARLRTEGLDAAGVGALAQIINNPAPDVQSTCKLQEGQTSH